MAQAQIGDLSMYYEIRGEGPPLIMIMGFTANVDWWPEVLLDQLAASYRLILMDNRGSGRTGGDGFSMARASHDIVALMDHLDVAQAHVLGISMGGMIAQELALDHPDRIGGLILGCTWPGPFAGRIFSRKQMRIFGPLMRKGRKNRVLLPNLLFSREFLAENPREVRQFMRRVAIAPIDDDARRDQFRAILGFHSYRRLVHLQAPTLILAGGQDVMIPVKNAHMMARRIPDARLEIFPECGHAFIGEAPHKTAEIVLDFLENIEKAIPSVAKHT